MKLTPRLSDEAVLREVGDRLASHRLNHNLTQAEVADRAGVSKRTVERIEAGHGAQLATLLRVLRVLELFDGLEVLVPPPPPDPLARAARDGRDRKRATGSRGAPEDPPDEPFVWGDQR